MILVDAGPLVALVDESDAHHVRCVSALKEVAEPMGTVWPAVAEALYLLQDVPDGQQAVLEMLRRRVVRLMPLAEEDVTRLQELMAKYVDLPMDLADAALVRVAERDGLDRVFTLDRRDFGVYRIEGRKAFRVIPDAPARRRGPTPRRRPRSRRTGRLKVPPGVRGGATARR